MAAPSNAINAQDTKLKGVLVETASFEFEATGKLIKRTTGSFITSGFLAGMELESNDGSNAVLGTITLVEALQLTVTGTVVDVAAASKTLTAKALVGELQNFNGPGGQSSDIDVTTLQSTAKEFRRGLQDEGEISFDLNLDPSDAGQIFCRTARAEVGGAAGLRSFELILPDTAETTLTFDAFVKGFSISGGVDDVVKASMMLRITGPVVWS